MLFFENYKIKNPDQKPIQMDFSFFKENSYKRWDLLYKSNSIKFSKAKKRVLIDEAVAFKTPPLLDTGTFC